MSKVKVSAENFQKSKFVINEIYALLHELHNDTGGYSTSIHILEHPNFEKLIAKGDRIVPFLFYTIMQHGVDWVTFLLLEKITGEHPVPKESTGKLYEVLIAWLQWFVNSKYYHTDVYYGLVENEDGELPIFEKQLVCE
jgi:hypothetical protein